MDTLHTPIVHLLSGAYIMVGAERRDVPEGSRQLLAFVAMRRRRIERRQAAAVLWPIGDEERAAGNLRSALWRLRRAGIDILVADKWSLALGTDVRVDLHALEEWATRMIEGRPAEPDLHIPSIAGDALNLFPYCYDDWALIERERVRQRVLHALEVLSERLTAAGRFADAIDAAMVAVGAEPLRESSQRVLIKAHIAEGNVTEATRIFLAYRNLMRRELGVVPPESFAMGLGIPMGWPGPGSASIGPALR